MKADLNSLKREIKRLADVEFIKRELNRIAAEITKFDLHIPLTPEARKSLRRLERRFKDLMKALAHLQKQVDSRVSSFVTMVKRGAKQASAAKKPKRKKAARKASKRK